METKEKLTEIIGNVVVNDKGNRIRDVFHPEFVEKIVNNLIEGGCICPPCKLEDEINGEIVHEIEYSVFLSQGSVQSKGLVHTMNKNDIGSTIFCSHPMSWEEAEKALKGGEG